VWPLASWFRFLIKSAPGRAVAYVDLVSAEYGIAAALSGDVNMRADYQSGNDVYEQLGEKVGRPRKIAKVASLATGYGQKAWGLAQAISTREKPVSVRIARDIINSIDEAYPQRRAWVEAQQTEAEFLGYMDSILGWRLKLTPSHYDEGNALLNFPMQSGCADIMRLAVVYMRDAGLMLCTTVHDAVMLESNSEDILAHVKIAQECWARASRELLGGFALRSDYKIACSCGQYPSPHGQDPKDEHQGRYNDKDGLQMWNRVQALLAEIEAEQPAAVSGAAQGEI
jgi:DNA polymerase I